MLYIIFYVSKCINSINICDYIIIFIKYLWLNIVIDFIFCDFKECFI